MHHVEYTATPEILEAMARAEYDTRPYGRLRRISGMLMGLVLSLVAGLSLWRFSFAAFKADTAPEIPRLLLCLFLIQLLVGIVLLLHKPLTIAWRKRQLKPLQGQTFDFTLTEEGISSPSMGTSMTLPWSFFTTTNIPNQGTLLRRGDLCYWLPGTSLAEIRTPSQGTAP